MTQNGDYILNQLEMFANQTRANDINEPMRTIAVLLTDDERHALASIMARDWAFSLRGRPRRSEALLTVTKSRFLTGPSAPFGMTTICLRPVSRVRLAQFLHRRLERFPARTRHRFRQRGQRLIDHIQHVEEAGRLGVYVENSGQTSPLSWASERRFIAAIRSVGS